VLNIIMAPKEGYVKSGYIAFARVLLEAERERFSWA
jgi:hypothetical protein